MSASNDPDAANTARADFETQVGELHAAPAPPVDLHLEVAAVVGQVSGIRHAVRDAARAHNVSESVIADIGLAITEASANVVTHAYRNAAGPGPLTVEAYHADEEFVVTVTDEGTGISPRSDSPGLGLGLALIARLTRRLEITTNQPAGCTVLMAFATRGA